MHGGFVCLPRKPYCHLLLTKSLTSGQSLSLLSLGCLVCIIKARTLDSLPAVGFDGFYDGFVFSLKYFSQTGWLDLFCRAEPAEATRSSQMLVLHGARGLKAAQWWWRPWYGW